MKPTSKPARSAGRGKTPPPAKRTPNAARPTAKAARPTAKAARPTATRAGAAAKGRGRSSDDVFSDLGVGVGDAFALERLGGPTGPRDGSRGGVREIGWAEFGDLARDLANRIAEEWAPDVVLAVAHAGVFVGGAIAPVFNAELVHLHLPGRGSAERLPRLSGKKVLVVDDAANSGKTLRIAVKAAQKARAAEVRSAVIALRPGGAQPDWSALETGDVVVFGWDYQFNAGTDGDPGDAGV